MKSQLRWKERHMSEETFLTLLQQIQRQYCRSRLIAESVTAIHQQHRFTQPPDEAACALGKGLGRSFLDLIKSSSPTSNSSSSLSLPVSNGIQKELYTLLTNQEVNPAVCQGFFDAILGLNFRGSNNSYYEATEPIGSRSDDNEAFVNLNGLFPACILFTEQKYLSNDDDNNDDDDDDDVIFGPLTCQIRAYAHYTRNILKFCECKIKMNKKCDESTMLEDQSLYTRIIAKTYSKLQTLAGRTAMLREFTSVAFVGSKQQHRSHFSSQFSFSSSSQVYRHMLTPLLVCCVLSSRKLDSSGNNDSSMTEMFCMEGIWREIYVLIDEESESEIDSNGLIKNNYYQGKDKYIDKPNEELPASVLLNTSSYLLNIIEWLREMLNLYLLSIPSRKIHLRIACKELAHRWLATLLDVGVFVVKSFPLELVTGKIDSSVQITTEATPVISSITKHDGNHHQQQQQQRLTNWFEGIVSESLLRWFATLPSYRVQMMGNFWFSLRTLMAIYVSQRPLSLQCTLKLATMAMCHPLKEDVNEILMLLAIAADKMTATTEMTTVSPDSRSLHPIAFSIMKGLGSIFLRDPVCAFNTKYLLTSLTRMKKTNALHVGKTENLLNLIQLFNDKTSINEIMCYFVSCEDDLTDPNHKFSAIQQAGSLILFGLGLLNNTMHRAAAYIFLRHFLLVYPHLGISVLPVVVDSINSAAVRGEGELMMEHIGFLTEVIARDTQCAREIWNLLGKELMRECIPPTIRSFIIRLYPKICKSNKRLYKRIIESMGNMMSITDNCNNREHDVNLEIHLAIAATTADLARENFVRDPTDVIGWLQNFITDAGFFRSTSKLEREEASGKVALIHYSILALHSLVISEALDFKLVLVVLGKRLCSIDNLEEVSNLPPLVLEALIILLGDGESEEDDSDEDEGYLKAIGVSPQISRSVEILIGLWSHKCLRPELSSDPTIRTTIFRCQRNILNSLTKYSFKAMGIDEEGIQVVCVAAIASDDKRGTINQTQTGSRYNDFKHLISDGIAVVNMLELCEGFSSSECQEELSKNVPDSFSHCLLTFTSKILKLEEDSLGSSLWQKRHSVREKNPPKKIRLNDGFRSKLLEPLPSRKSVLNAFNENRCQATSLAALLSFKDEGNSMALLSDLAIDATNDSSDPLVLTLYVQSWLNAARSVLSGMISTTNVSENIDKLLRYIQEWRLDKPDSMYMFSSTVAMLIPTILGPYGDYTSYINDISNDVWEAYHSRAFEDPDVAKLCLGFVGACDVSLGNIDRLINIVKCLEKSVSGYGGLPSFGAYFSLAVIAQTCVSSKKIESIESPNSPDIIELVKRILIFLINELSKCIKESQTGIDILVSSIKKKTISHKDVDVLAVFTSKLKVTESKKRTATSIFIALGICLPALTEINDKLLLLVLSFLECIEWGCGKGFSLHSVLRACCQSGILEKREVKRKYENYLKILQEGTEQGIVGLDDISYAMTAIQPKTKSYPMQKRLTVGSRDSLVGAGLTLSFVSAVSSISSIPCLGHGSNGLLTDFPCLLEATTRADVAGVVEFVSNGSIDNEQNPYSHQIATTLRGFLASLTIITGPNEIESFTVVGDNQRDRIHAAQLPEAHLGTGLNIVLTSLQNALDRRNNLQKNPKIGLVTLLGCLEVLSLPAQFSIFLMDTLSTENDDSMKAACIKLLISQIRGRPRAVFDGREFVNSALKISKMPTITLRNMLGELEAAEYFVGSFGDILTKFISEEVDTVTENIFQFCTSLIDRNFTLIVRFFRSIKRLLLQAAHDKSSRFSLQSLKCLQLFLKTAFWGISDAASTVTECVPYNQISNIVEAYADCLIELPDSLFLENKFSSQDCDSFSGECLRIRVIMTLIQKNRSSLSSQSYREIASSIAWMSQQLVVCRDEVFSTTILQVACTIAETICKATADGMKDIIISFLDNLLMVNSAASFVALEILAALVYQDGFGSDGDLSLLRTLGTSIGKWVDLPPQILKKAFKLAVHDLPFNLARYTRREKLSGVVYNRLWRIYVKWQKQGTDEATLAHLRISLICCRDTNTVINVEDFVVLANSFVSE